MLCLLRKLVLMEFSFPTMVVDNWNSEPPESLCLIRRS